MARAKKDDSTNPPTTIVAYKGFDENLTCRGFAYTVGTTYKHDGEVKACESGFHACEHPLNVFEYYPPATSRFAVVELGGKTAREHGGDTKIAAAEITIKAELRLPEIIAAAIRYVVDRVKWIDGDHATGDGEGAKNSQRRGAATASGWQGAATASGDQGAATASGYQGKVRGKEGCALFLVERETNGTIIHAWAGIAGRDGIKSDTWYQLDNGQPVEIA